MKQVKVCKKCSGLDVKELKSDAKGLDCKIKIGCIGKCARKCPEFSGKVHGVLDGVHIVCDTKEAFLEKIKGTE